MIERDGLPGDANHVFTQQQQQMFGVDKFHGQRICN